MPPCRQRQKGSKDMQVFPSLSGRVAQIKRREEREDQRKVLLERQSLQVGAAARLCARGDTARVWLT